MRGCLRKMISPEQRKLTNKKNYKRIKNYRLEFDSLKKNMSINSNFLFADFMNLKKNWEICPFCKKKYELRKDPKRHTRRCPKCLKSYEV